MNTREIAEEYRLLHWAGILQERKESGQSIRSYCKQAGIHENVFYYWQRKLRETAIEELPGQGEMRAPAPEGWVMCTTPPEPPNRENSEATPCDQLIVEAPGVRIKVGRAYPVGQLAQLLRELMKGC